MAVPVSNEPVPNSAERASGARDVGEALKRLDFAVLYGLDASRSYMMKLLEQFIDKAQTADVALFFYAGHGVQVLGQNYVVPARGSPYKDGIPISNLYELLAKAPAEVVFILDSCQTTFATDDLRHASSSQAAAGAVIRGGMAELDAGAGTLVAYAAAPGSVAYNGAAGRHSVFTGALLSNIETPNVEINVMLRNVRADVIPASRGEQVPAVQSLLHKPFYFRRESTLLSW